MLQISKQWPDFLSSPILCFTTDEYLEMASYALENVLLPKLKLDFQQNQIDARWLITIYVYIGLYLGLEAVLMTL